MSMTNTRVTVTGPLLPASLRKPAVAVIVLCGVVFLALAARVAGDSRAGPVDRAIASFVHGAVPLSPRHLLEFIGLGNAEPVIGAALGLAAVALALGLRRVAAVAILGPLITGIATTGGKPLVERTIRGSLAYPSGHTGAWTALGLVVALILIGALSAGPLLSAVLLAVGGCGAGVVMAMAMVANFSHYPSDTVGGFCIAVVAVLGMALVLERLPRRRIPNAGD